MTCIKKPSTEAMLSDEELWTWHWVPIFCYNPKGFDHGGPEIHEYIAPSGTLYLRFSCNALIQQITALEEKTNSSVVIFAGGLKSEGREAVAFYERKIKERGI